MGTMANTLILAFAGSSLNMLILVQTYDIPFLQLINTDSIALEVVQSVAGSIGILLTVPLVAFISASLWRMGKSREFNIDGAGNKSGVEQHNYSEQEDEDEKERQTSTWRKTDRPVYGRSDGCVHAAVPDRFGGGDFLREDAAEQDLRRAVMSW